MKKKIVTALSITILMILTAFPLVAQTTHPGDPGGSPQTGDPPLGGGAPIGGGTFILMALGAAYGGKKLVKLKQNQNEN